MERPKVVIVGAGFAGLEAAKALGRANVELLVIDRTNHFLFQPLLYQVATAGLSPAEIAVPIRAVLRAKNTSVLMGEVTGMDRESKHVLVQGQAPVPFDYLILATGAGHSYFDHPEWAEFAPGLKTLDEALAIRSKVLLAFEKAEAHPEQRREWLTFVIVGGGPTGVEMAGAITEIARHTLVREFDRICTESARVILIEATDRILGAFPAPLGGRAKADLEAMGVEVRLNTKVTAIAADCVETGDQQIKARTIIWAAGVAAAKLGEWLKVETDRAGRVKVQDDLTVPAWPEVYVLGDTALLDPPLPGIAPAAMQQGRFAARHLRARIEGNALPTFKYKDKGILATIGRSKAVGVVSRFHLTGFAAWFVWLFVHILYLVGFRNRFTVLINWLYSYLTWGRGARLISGSKQ